MTIDTLTQLQPPYFHIWCGSASEFCDFVWKLDKSAQRAYVVRIMQGTRMRNIAELFHEFAAALQFPYYFGANWNALEECLVDLEWLPSNGYILAISEADSLLSADLESFAALMSLLGRVAQFWASEPNTEFAEARERKPTPFHIVLHAENSDALVLRERISGLDHTISNWQ